MKPTERLRLAGLIKQALIGDNLNQALGGGFLGNAAELGSSFIPGVMTVDSAHDAARNFGRMFSGGSFRTALQEGAKGVGNLGMAALGLLPFGGAAVKGMRTGRRLLGWAGKPVARQVSKVPGIGAGMVRHPFAAQFGGGMANSHLQGMGNAAAQRAEQAGTSLADAVQSARSFMGNRGMQNPADIRPPSATPRFDAGSVWGGEG
jgi:hypothetical protein